MAKKPNGDSEKRRKKAYSRQHVEDVAEIGPPQLTDEQREEGNRLRELCRDSLLAFNTEVFPNSTGLKPMGDVQRQSISHDESVIRDGGRICKAEPRAYGKTSRTCNAALKAVLYNERRMIPVFSANLEKSKNQIMARWKTELMSNERLFWMFPELVWPFRALENKPQRCASQTYRGELTYIKWTADRIVFPTIEGVEGSGNILIALPLKSCRGATHTTPDGTILRPELLIFDDVQMDEDADNPNTVRKLEELIDHTAMMLGGHSQTMSAIMNCTVRKPDDLSEVFLSKPSWRRVRYKMLENPADHEKEFWLGEYADIRRRYDPESPDDQRRAHRDSLNLYKSKLDYANQGAVITWDWAYTWADDDPLEISAIQHAYNILIDLGDTVFASECQNEPIRETGGLAMLSEKEIRSKQSGFDRGSVPKDATVLTASVDVHPEILYYHVWAFEPGFTSYLVEDGTYPRQATRNFRHDMLDRTLSQVFRGHDQSATVFGALGALLAGNEELQEAGLLNREFGKADGTPMRISQVGIDASGSLSDPINKFIRQSAYSAMMVPTYGQGITARKLPMHLYTQHKEGDDHWVRRKPKPGEVTGLLFDTNYWKASFHRALALPLGSQGGASLYSVENPEHWYRFASACHSERPVEVTAEGRTVYEFGEPRLGTFNHDFDCAIIARVMASKAGIRSFNATKPKKRRLTLAEMAARARSVRR